MYKPVIEVLDRGPMTVRELVASQPAARLEWSGLLDAIKVLVGRGDLQPALPAENEAERAASARAFNAAVTALAKDSEDLGYLASPVTGGGVRVDRLTQLYLQAKTGRRGSSGGARGDRRAGRRHRRQERQQARARGGPRGARGQSSAHGAADDSAARTAGHSLAHVPAKDAGSLAALRASQRADKNMRQ